MDTNMAYLLLGITKISGWESGDLEVDVAAGCGPGISASEVSLNSHSAKRATTTGRKLSQTGLFYFRKPQKKDRRNVMQAISILPRLNIFA